MRKLTLLITMLFLSVGMAWAQLADGVYTINNTINNRGTMCFGTSGGTEYLGLTGITYTGLSGKSVTVTEDANKYWYVQTVNGTTYIYNIGKGVFLKDSGADVATSDSNCNGFTLVTKSSGGTSYISVMNGSRYLTFSPGYEASAGQVRWRTVEEGDAVYLTFTPVENGTVTYKTQVTAAKSKILLSTANETGAVYTIEGGSLNEHRGFLAAGEGYNDYPVLSDIAWSSHSSKSTPAIDNGKNWYVYRKAENEWYIYNVALEKFLAAEDGNINFSPFPYSWVIAENTQGGVNYLVIKDASKGVSFACGSTPSDRNVKHYYSASDGGSMHIFTPAQGDFSAQIAANVKAKLNMPAPGSYIRIKSVATEAYLSSVNHATQTTRAAYVADADVTTIFKFDGTSLYSYASRQYLVNNSNFLGYGSTESGAAIEFQAANVSLNLENAYSIKLFGTNRWLYAQPDNYTDAGSGNNDDNYSFYLEEVTELPVAHINNVGYTTLEDAKTAALATTEAVEIVLLAGSDATIVFPANVTINKNGFTANNLAVAVAKIGNVLYATLAEAVDAAQADQTVVLLKDTEETLVLPAGVKLDKSNVTAPNVNEAAAKVGETLYASIEAALAAAQADETITLVADVTCTEKPVFNNGGVVNVDINGHKFVSSEKARVRCVGNSTVASNNIKFVRGFGWEAYYNADEKFRVFPTLDEAVAYKSGTNAANIYPYEDVVQDKDITFCTTGEQTSTALTNDAGYKTSWDLNGFTVLQETAAGNPLESTVLGEFTLLDSSAEKTGKWIAGAYNGNTGGGPAFIVNRADAHLILQGGTISIARNGDVVNTDGLINTYYGTLTVDGATLQMDDLYGIMAWGGNVVVKSGEFVLGENNRSSVFAKKHYSDASVTINANLGGTLYAHSSATATVNVPGVKYYVSGTDYVAPDVAEGLVAQDGVVGYPVAKIGEAGYLTLQAALAAVQDGETITLIDNVTVSEATAAYNDGTYIDGVRYTGDKSFTVDFNGKTVTDDGCVNDYLIYINNKGEKASEITFTNGTIVSANGCWSAVCVNSSAATQNVVLNLNGMNITNSNDAEYSGNPVVRARDLATVNVNDGTIITSNGASYGVAANTDGSTLNINEGATIVQQNSGTTGGNSVFAAVGGKGVINIKGGTITSDKFGVHTMTTGTPVINISGGTITAPVALKSSTNGGNGELATINVTGGTINGTLETYTENGKIVVSGGTFSEAVAQEYCAEGFVCEANGDGTYGVQFASYIVLPDGVNSSNYAELFGDNTVTDGTNYYATLQAAVEAVAGQANAVLYCKPGADVGSLQHAPVTSTLTVYGNGADVTGDTERDFDLGNTDPSSGNDITADMTLTVKHLNGCGAWGNKATEHTVNLVFENCANMGKVFITGTTGTLNITMTNCAFEGVIKEAVYSNADGAITLTNVAFSNLNKAVNLNHKAAGTQTVTIDGCTFTNCGADVAADQIPVRVLSSVEGGKSVLAVTGSTFTGTPEGGADILLDYGVGHTTASVSGTAANVVVEKENNVGTTTAVKAEETVEFTTALPVAKVGEQGYETFADAYNAAQEGETITLLQDVKLAGKLTIGKAVTIDGDGHSIIADETAVWYTVSGKLNIKSYKTHLLGVNAGGIVLKNVVLDCNNNAAGINVYGAQGVVFDNVSIINATKGMAALTVNGSTVNFKTAFTALGNSIAMDISNGSGVTSALGVTVDEGTVFNLGNKVVKFDSVANVETLANAVDAEGKAYFAAKDNAYYYTIAQMESRTTAYSNGLTLLADVELANNALNVKGTLNLNGHSLTATVAPIALPDGYAALQNLDGKYVIGTRPTATIENLGSMVVEAGEYFVKNLQGSGDNSKDMPLQFVMKYTADQTAADVATSPYKEWYADFVLSFTGLSSGSFVADEDTYLAGFYGETEKWEGIWAKVGITGMEITEGTRYPVMMGVGMPQNYEYICAGVEEFLCAMNISSEILAANPDLKVTLELCVVDNSNDELALNALQTGSDKCNVAAVKEFVADDFEKVELPEVVITDIKGSLTDSDPDLTFALNFAIKDVESLTDEYLEKLFAQYGDWYTDYVLTISGLTDEDVTFNANGGGDGYLSGQYDAWSENWVSVPFEDVTLANGASIYIMEYAAKLMGQSGLRFTLAEVAEIVQNFDCGVYFTPEFLAANPGLKVDLHLKVFTEDAEGNKVNDINVATNNFDIEDYVAIVHADGKQTKYCTTLADAVAAAADGATVTMLGDVELTEAVKVVGKAITLDLNGKTVSGTCNAGQSSLVYIENNAALTVVDNSDAKDGKLTYAKGTSNVGWTVDVKGAFTLEEGTVELTGDNWSIGYAVDVRPNSWGTEYTNPSVFTMNGGKLVSSDGAVRVASSSAPAHKQVAASFEMNGGAIDAAWDGVFVQQSDATYDVLSFTMNGGTIESGLNPVRVYGPAATGYVNGADCMNISFNGGTMTYTGTETREWVIDGILRVGGGSSMETILESGNITATAEFADANALPEGYQWEQDGETYKVVEAPKAPEVVDGKIEFVDGEFDMYTNDTDIENVEITYKRTIDSDWNALYVPFAIPASELLADFDIAYINDVRETDADDDGELDGWQMELIKIKKETAVLRANHPYFVRSKSADYTENNLSLTLTTTLYKATVAEFECSSVYSTYTVKGLNELRASTEFGDADRVLGYDNGETTWGKMADGYSLKPFRFYLTITNHDGSPVVSSSAQMSIVVRDEDGTTGIDGIYGDESGETVIFDLYGRRVLEPEKGNIYIINGKKVMVK